VVRRAARLRGELRLPGDKSISHRALLLAALAEGESRIREAGDGLDVRSSAAAIDRLGVTVTISGGDGRTVDYRVVSPGVGGLHEPDDVIDCGNSGTTLRLAAGILARLPVYGILDGDASLRRRPVARIIDPLRSMGAVLHARRGDSLPPLTVVGRTRSARSSTPTRRARRWSAVLLAGLGASGARRSARPYDPDHGTDASSAGRAGQVAAG
jgi:3-phosphoshikimate 1-carboxyvinyltransferase